MSYIGASPIVGNFQVCDAISVVNNQAAYTMQVGSANVFPESANHMLVSLNGILQKPNGSFTISGSTITFSSNLVTGDVIDFIQLLGDVLDLGTPSDSTVSLAKLTATGTKDSTTFLRGDNTFDVPPLGGITMADQWRLSANQELSTNDITANIERVDDAGVGFVGSAMTVSSGVFTFPSTGIYRVEVNATFSKNTDGGGARYMMVRTQTTTNNSTYANVARAITNIDDCIANTVTASCASIIYLDVTNTSNVKVKFTTSSATGTDHFLQGTTADNYTTFTFTRLGDT